MADTNADLSNDLRKFTVKFHWPLLILCYVLLAWGVNAAMVINNYVDTVRYVVPQLKDGNCSALNEMYLTRRAIDWNGTAWDEVEYHVGE